MTHEPDDRARGGPEGTIDARIAALDWQRIAADLDAEGHALIGGLLESAECRALAAAYIDEPRFRSRVVMQRHGFGRGEYRYFAHPLPALVAALRESFYERLAPIANRWNESLAQRERYPREHAQFLARCHAAGQTRPTPLLLRYTSGDYNCLHQDLYGEQRFPLQLVVLLSQPGRDFEGGELVLTEQRPRMQSRAMVLPLAARGDAALIAVNERPVAGARGFHRVRLRHGVSRVRRGERFTLGIVFHDAA